LKLKNKRKSMNYNSTNRSISAIELEEINYRERSLRSH